MCENVNDLWDFDSDTTATLLSSYLPQGCLLLAFSTVQIRQELDYCQKTSPDVKDVNINSLQCSSQPQHRKVSEWNEDVDGNEVVDYRENMSTLYNSLWVRLSSDLELQSDYHGLRIIPDSEWCQNVWYNL